MKRLIQNFRNLPLARKFALAILSLGLFPVLVLLPVFYYLSAESTENIIADNYNQAAASIALSAQNTLETYDSATRIMYQYNSQEGDVSFYPDLQRNSTVRQILEGPGDEREERMGIFLRTVLSTDTHIVAVHLYTDSSEENIGKQQYHYSAQSSWFRNDAAFRADVNYDQLDKEYRHLGISMPHDASYFGLARTVVTFSRNYYDVKGAYPEYVGTIYIDVDISVLQRLFSQIQLSSGGEAYLLNESGDCYYSTDAAMVGKSGVPEAVSSDQMLSFESQTNDYGLYVKITIPETAAYAPVRTMLRGMLAILVIVLGALVVFSIWFSRSLTRPLKEITGEMKKVENGDFNINLPVKSRDEVGILSQSFNEMSAELEKYINQSYVAKIRQNEAELTALRSQIYPHFLYNTLEIIRMSALECGDERVSEMIEALSTQIHYLIGTMEDMVPLSREVDIIRKYIYLLNCRIEGKVSLMVDAEDDMDPVIPKLTLQPVVENAYVHGIRPKTGSGAIMIAASKVPSQGGEEKPDSYDLQIDVMDNGVGMDGAALQKIQDLLRGDQPGIKNKDNWQSIGLKNVHDRLRFLYGEAYGIHVTSTPGVGTSVRLLMPWKEKSDADDDHS